MTQAAEATGTYRREVRRVANRFLEGGVEHALSEEPRRRRSKLLDSAQTHAQARELAQRRGDRSQPRLQGVPRSQPHPNARGAAAPRPAVECSRGPGSSHDQLDVHRPRRRASFRVPLVQQNRVRALAPQAGQPRREQRDAARGAVDLSRRSLLRRPALARRASIAVRALGPS
ncbi:hypothetical protein [Sorangium sp. So ce341]|uniref:hypothetical protein n=1 Tax=Sorangium sp. So ce341 TaxID=3133302 RepID=UPI003F615068